MSVDPEIAPLMASTRATLDKLAKELLPLLNELDEDTIVTHYSLDEQARLYLAAAFTMAFSLYSLDKLNHRQHQVIQVSGAGTGSKHRGHGRHDGAENTTNPGVDAQLLLKIERITDYIKKLREITELARRKQQEEGQAGSGNGSATAPTAASTTTTTTTATNVEGQAVAGKDAGDRKRRREEEDQEDPHVRNAEVGGDGAGEERADDLGDATMFGVVSRVPGEAGVLVSRLLRQVVGSSKE